MTVRYVDPVNGNNTWDGLAKNFVSGTNGPKLTLNGAEDTPVVAGDIVHCRTNWPYRELLTVDVSGGNTYSTGTVSVTQGDATVTGSGTSWLANVAAAYIFHVTVLAHGTDGVGVNGGNHFTSAAGNFQVGHVGMTIRINTIAAYVIESVISATEITCGDAAGTDAAFTGQTGLTYDVGPEAPYEILSVTDDTHLELTQPWSGPSFTGLAYLTYNPIRYIADVSGAIWGDTGGMGRITGSDNDTTATRANCITATSKNYRLFRGFVLDMTTSYLLATVTSCSEWILEDFLFHTTLGGGITLGGTGTGNTIRRCNFREIWSHSVFPGHTSTIDNSAILLENCNFFLSLQTRAVRSDRIGGILIRNCNLVGAGWSIRAETAFTVGQAITVENCIFEENSVAIRGTITGEIIEDYNSFYANGTDRTNVTTGAHSNAYPALFQPQLSLKGFQFPQAQIFSLSKWSQIARIAGFNEAGDDFFGIQRPTTSAKRSWGAFQYIGATRETTTIQAGSASLKLPDAGEQQFQIVPVTAVSTTISIYCYREADYAGTNPQMIISQPGQADRVTTDAGAASGWNQLTDTFTPAASPPYVVVFVKSLNTAAAGNYDTFFDTLAVS